MQSNLSERLLDFAANIIKLVVRLNKTAVGRHIVGQLTRSGTSAGANYEEACGAESRADFIHKLQIVLKEMRESFYWLLSCQPCDVVSNVIYYLHNQPRRIGYEEIHRDTCRRRTRSSW